MIIICLWKKSQQCQNIENYSMIIELKTDKIKFIGGLLIINYTFNFIFPFIIILTFDLNNILFQALINSFSSINYSFLLLFFCLRKDGLFQLMFYFSSKSA